MNHENENIEIPLGLGMALAQNINIFEYFASLPAEQKKLIIDETHYINSREEMQAFVDALTFDMNSASNMQTFF